MPSIGLQVAFGAASLAALGLVVACSQSTEEPGSHSDAAADTGASSDGGDAGECDGKVLGDGSYAQCCPSTAADPPGEPTFQCSTVSDGSAGCGAPPDLPADAGYDATGPFPVGCEVALPWVNPWYPCQGPQTCTCQTNSSGAVPSWNCPL